MFYFSDRKIAISSAILTKIPANTKICREGKLFQNSAKTGGSSIKTVRDGLG